MSRIERARQAWAHAFAVQTDGEFSDDEVELIERLASLVVSRRMTAPAVMALESARPLSFIGSQALAFFQPMLSVAFGRADMDRLISIFERRDGVDLLLETIQRQEDDRA